MMNSILIIFINLAIVMVGFSLKEVKNRLTKIENENKIITEKLKGCE